MCRLLHLKHVSLPFEKHPAVISETSIVLANDESKGRRESHAKCSVGIVHCNEYPNPWVCQ
jgi:hypothetical protein